MFSILNVFNKFSTGIYLSKNSTAQNNQKFEINLSETSLKFSTPKTYFKKNNPLLSTGNDLRPFVNLKSQSQYIFHSNTGRGSCNIYKIAWEVYCKKRNEKPQFTLLLSVTLLTPSEKERSIFNNLFDVDTLTGWLRNHYTQLNIEKSNSSIEVLNNGILSIEESTHNETDHNIVYDTSPMSILFSEQSGLPLLIPEVDSHCKYYCLPISPKDVLTFRFKIIRTDLNNESTIKNYFKLARIYIENIIKSVDIKLSIDELNNLSKTKKN